MKFKSTTFVTLVKVTPLAPEPAEIQILEKLATDPAEIVLLVEEVSVVLMVAELPENVSPVVVAVVHTVPVEASVHVPVPMVIVRVLLLDELNNPIEKLLLLASKVPLVSITALVAPTVKASANWKVPPTPLKVKV